MLAAGGQGEGADAALPMLPVPVPPVLSACTPPPLLVAHPFCCGLKRPSFPLPSSVDPGCGCSADLGSSMDPGCGRGSGPYTFCLPELPAHLGPDPDPGCGSGPYTSLPELLSLPPSLLPLPWWWPLLCRPFSRPPPWFRRLLLHVGAGVKAGAPPPACKGAGIFILNLT